MGEGGREGGMREKQSNGQEPITEALTGHEFEEELYG